MASTLNDDAVATLHSRTRNRPFSHGWNALRTHADLLIGGTVLLTVVAFLLVYRQVNLDEGWYLWASKLVLEGKLLYRDFAYTQTPLLPYVYGLSQQVLGEGLIQGRLLTGFFTLGVVGLSVATAARVAGRTAATVCLMLCAVSLFALAQYTYTATYALSGFLLAAALFVAASQRPEDWRNVVAAGLICLAVGVRLSVSVAGPLLLIYLVWTSHKRLRALLLVTCAAAGALAPTLGLYWLLSGELMSYDIFGFHTDRLLKVEWQRLRIWHTWQRTVEDFLALLAVTVAAALAGCIQLGQNWGKNRPSAELSTGAFLLLLAGMAAALFGAHLSPRTTDSYYNALQTPLMCLAAGILAAQWLAQEQPARRIYLWALIALLVVVHGGRQWRGFVRDAYVVWPLRSQVSVVREAATLSRRLVPSGAMLLSFSPHLALEAGLRVIPGYEMAIFAYQPSRSDGDAERYHLVNNTRLLGDLRRGAGVVALTSFDLEQIYGERAAVQSILASEYRWFASIPDFGPYNDPLNVYLPPQFGDPQPQVVRRATLADHIELLGYDLKESRQNGEKTLTVALYWRAEATPTRPYTVFVQLLDARGERAVGWDNPPCRGTCPTITWQADEYVRDEYTLSLSGLTTGNYTLHTGMYDPESGQRLAVIGVDGQPVGDNLLLAPIQQR